MCPKETDGSGRWEAMAPRATQVRLLSRKIPGCRRCSRLAAFLEETRLKKPDWWNRPVPGFGDPEARLLVLGLAPGRGGANRTGRPFTGDAAGVWLFKGLFDLGLSSRAEVESSRDGTVLKGVYITNVVKCVPPGNRPTPAEIRACRPFLEEELKRLRSLERILALGRVAYQGLKALVEDPAGMPPFSHGARGAVRVAGRDYLLVCSYHPSRQNTNTGRLTWSMWMEALTRAAGKA